MSENNTPEDDRMLSDEEASAAADAAAMADIAAEEERAAEEDAEFDGVYSDEEAKLIIAEAEVADLKDKLLRAVAESENIRRRAQRDVEDARKFAVTDFARDMLSVADNMRRAIDAVSPEARTEQPEVKSLLEGVELTERDLLGTLERHNIQTVNPMGEKLDPNLHQAVIQIEETDAAPGTVVQVMQVGYTLNGRILRPAMVGVAK